MRSLQNLGIREFPETGNRHRPYERTEKELFLWQRSQQRRNRVQFPNGNGKGFCQEIFRHAKLHDLLSMMGTSHIFWLTKFFLDSNILMVVFLGMVIFFSLSVILGSFFVKFII